MQIRHWRDWILWFHRRVSPNKVCFAFEKYISGGVDVRISLQLKNVFLEELIAGEAAVQIFHIKDWVWSLSSSHWLGIQNFAWQNISPFSKGTCPESNFQSQIRAKKARNGQKISSQPLVLRHLDAGKIQFLLPLPKKKKKKDQAEKSDFSSFHGFLPLNAFSVASIKILWMALEVSPPPALSCAPNPNGRTHSEIYSSD